MDAYNDYVRGLLHRAASFMRYDVAKIDAEYGSKIRSVEHSKYFYTTTRNFFLKALPLLKKYEALAQTGRQLIQRIEDGEELKVDDLRPLFDFYQDVGQGNNIHVYDAVIDSVASLRISSQFVGKTLDQIIGDEFAYVEHFCKELRCRYEKIQENVRDVYSDEGSDTETEQ